MKIMQIMTKESQLRDEIRTLTGQLYASYGNIKRLVEENKRLTEEIKDLKFTTAKEYMEEVNEKFEKTLKSLDDEEQEVTMSDLDYLRDP